MAINDSGAGQTDVDDVDKNDVLISVSFTKRCDLTLKLKKYFKNVSSFDIDEDYFSHKFKGIKFTNQTLCKRHCGVSGWVSLLKCLPPPKHTSHTFHLPLETKCNWSLVSREGGIIFFYVGSFFPHLLFSFRGIRESNYFDPGLLFFAVGRLLFETTEMRCAYGIEFKKIFLFKKSFWRSSSFKMSLFE